AGDVNLSVVVHEGVQVSTRTDEAISFREAVHTVSFQARDETGQGLFPDLWQGTLVHRVSGAGFLYLVFHGAPVLRTNSIGPDYDIDVTQLAHGGDATYFVPLAVVDGIAGSRTISNAPADLTRGVVRYHPRPTDHVTD